MWLQKLLFISLHLRDRSRYPLLIPRYFLRRTLNCQVLDFRSCLLGPLARRWQVRDYWIHLHVCLQFCAWTENTNDQARFMPSDQTFSLVKDRCVNRIVEILAVEGVITSLW